MSNRRYNIPGSHLETEKPSTLNFHFSVPAETGSADQRSADKLQVKLLYISSAQYGSDWNCMVHSHTFLELLFVTSGVGKFRFNDKTIKLNQNDLIIINPYVEHTEFSQQENPMEYIVLGIDGLQFTKDSTDDQSGSIFRIQNVSTIGTYISHLLKEAQDRDMGYESVCTHLLDIILTMLLRQQGVALSISTSPYIPQFCAQAKDYIDTHFKEPLDLDSLADIIQQNKYYFAHAFNSAYSISPMRYLIKRRIDEGRFLLSDTTMPIYDISSIIGFSSPSHFAQAFKRITGQTPNAYRKEHRPNNR